MANDGYRLTGLWQKNAGGRTLFSGSCTRDQLREMVGQVDASRTPQDPPENQDKFSFTVWVNDADDKRSETSPDASVVVAKPWVKEQRASATPVATGVVDDIPF